MTKTDVRIALTNLGLYNEGELRYTWITLPASEDDIEEAYEIIGIDGIIYEETFISDYESPFKIGEYDNIDTLNEIAERIDDLDDCEKGLIEPFIEEYSDDIDETLSLIEGSDYSIMYDCSTMAHVAMYMVEEGYFGENLEINNLLNYIDYESLGRDISYDGTFIQVGNDMIQIF